MGGWILKTKIAAFTDTEESHPAKSVSPFFFFFEKERERDRKGKRKRKGREKKKRQFVVLLIYAFIVCFFYVS